LLPTERETAQTDEKEGTTRRGKPTIFTTIQQHHQPTINSEPRKRKVAGYDLQGIEAFGQEGYVTFSSSHPCHNVSIPPNNGHHANASVDRSANLATLGLKVGPTSWPPELNGQ